MLLKNKHNKNQYWVLYLVMAIANRHKDEVSFYLNSYRISGYLATKGIKISQPQVSEFLTKMVKEDYLYMVGMENFAYGKGDKNKLSITYAQPDLQAMNDDLHQYSLKYYEDFKLDIENYINHPHFLEETYGRYAEYCDSVKEDIKRDDALAMLREHPVHQQYEALVAECNAFVTDDFLTIRYADDERLRASSKLCPTPNPENHLKETDDNYGDLTRFKHLAGYFGTERVGDVIDDTICEQFGIQEIDVKASIYRLTYNLVHNETLDPSIDLYEQFYYYCPSLKKGFRDDVTDIWESITGESASRPIKVRDLVKNLSMPLYMRAGSRKNACKKYGNEWAIAVECNNRIKPEDRNRYYTYKVLEKVFGISIYTIVEEWYQAMRKVLGVNRFLQDKIFWYESDLYIAMVKEFRSRGIKTANVYDGFYFKAGTITKEEFYEVYDACLNELKAKIKELAPEDTAKLVKPVTKITEKETDDKVYRIREKVEVQQVAIVTDVPTTKKSYCEGLPLLGMSNLPVMQKVKNWV